MGDYAAKLNRIRKVLDFIQFGGQDDCKGNYILVDPRRGQL